MKKYTVELWDEGIVVKGPIPIDELQMLIKKAEKLGFDQFDAGVSQAFGASCVITNAEGSKKLREHVEKSNAGLSKLDQWIYGSDTGMSSKTIFGVMTGKQVGEGSHPYDPDDFGRCYRLLKLFPEWVGRLPEVAARYPRWAGLIAVWPELTALFESKEYEELYKKMQAAYK